MKKLLTLTIVMFMASSAMAASSSITPTKPGYTANDILTGYAFGGFDVSGSQVVGWATGTGSSLKVLAKDGSSTTDLGTPDYGGTTYYNSFVRLDPSGNSVWAGFTVGDNSDDRIYQVNVTTKTWTQKATLAGNFDLEFSGGNPYVSGLNGETGNSIWLLDTSGSNNHDLIASIDGNSTGLAFDSSGNLYNTTYDGYGTASVLLKYTSTQVTGAVGASSLTRNDATKLSDTPAGAYDTTCDADGNVLFNINGSFTGHSNFTAIWNGTSGNGYNYNELAYGTGAAWNWHTFLDAEGIVTESGEGTFYQVDWCCNGIAEVTVPEPATMCLLAVGGIGVLLRRRRNRG
ncbi:MAG: PEP-CTERM sorting domain-containing protein [Phycisphaerae bacterium]|nr:PEP-CTERM sorting domain-containing protein [Phycisphaerae bacterium]